MRCSSLSNTRVVPHFPFAGVKLDWLLLGGIGLRISFAATFVASLLRHHDICRCSARIDCQLIPAVVKRYHVERLRMARARPFRVSFLADLNAAAHSTSSSAAVRRGISAIIDESQSHNPILHESL